MQPRTEPLRSQRHENLLPIPFFRPNQSAFRSHITTFLNSRRGLQDNYPSISNTRFGLHAANTTSPLNTPIEQPILDSPNDSLIPNETEFNCQYCNMNIISEAPVEHLENCEMRKINCEKCGQKILVDMFDVHAEECSFHHQRARDQYLRRSESEDEEDNNNYDSSSDMQVDDDMYLSESELTYERLLMLDATVEKKGMTPEQLKMFPVQLYVKSLDGEGFCVICMSEYQTGEYVRKLSCQHKFHKGCIDQWLDSNITCPTCKKYLR